MTITIGNTSKTLDLDVVSDDEFWEETTNPSISTGRVHVLTKSEAEELGTLNVYGSDFYSSSSIDVLVNGNRVETIDSSYPDTDIDISDLPIGEHIVEFTHPTGSATTTFNIISDETGPPASEGTFEGLTYQYQAGGFQSSDPFELPIRFEIDENGMLQNLRVEYWWVCVLANPDNQSGFSYADGIPPTQISVNQPFQIDWEEYGDYSFVGVINEDGTASGKFFAYSSGCGTNAADWNLVSDMAPEPEPDPEPEPEEFEVELDLDTTEETEGPVTISVTTTSDTILTSLKWLDGERNEGDFENAGNEIDLETLSFTVVENGTYTIYALNTEGVVALSTITIDNIIDPDDDNGTDPGDGNGTDPGDGDGTDPGDGDGTDPGDGDGTDPGDGDGTDPGDGDGTDPGDGDGTDDGDDTGTDDGDDTGNGDGDGTDDGDDTGNSDGDGTDDGDEAGTVGDTDSDDNTLPATATNVFNLMIIGVAILMLGFAFMVFTRRQNA